MHKRHIWIFTHRKLQCKQFRTSRSPGPPTFLSPNSLTNYDSGINVVSRQHKWQFPNPPFLHTLTHALSKTSHSFPKQPLFHQTLPIFFSLSKKKKKKLKLLHFPRRRHVRTQPAALPRAAAHRTPLDPSLRIGGSAPVRLQRRGGLRGRGSATSTWDGRVRRLGVGPRERGAVGPHGGPWNQATRVRREALEASPSSSHFHGHLGPPRAPPSLFSLQTGQLRFLQFFWKLVF